MTPMHLSLCGTFSSTTDEETPIEHAMIRESLRPLTIFLPPAVNLEAADLGEGSLNQRLRERHFQKISQAHLTALNTDIRTPRVRTYQHSVFVDQ